MLEFKPYSLNIAGRLTTIDRPLVMGILNTTPDSFYAGSRCDSETLIRKRVRQIAEEKADIIDVGGYSSRPNAADIPEEEEYRRLAAGLRIIRQEMPEHPLISIDTFRSSVAERCVEEFGAHIVNDISAGELDPNMISTVARLKVPYIMMHMRGNPHTMSSLTDYADLTADMLRYFGRKIEEASAAGICDLIVDPGFGFSKTLDQNYELLGNLDIFKELDRPILVGVSRKSMIYKLFGTTPAESLNGTTAINAIALMKGAAILRVHDVKEAVETVGIYRKTFLTNNHETPS